MFKNLTFFFLGLFLFSIPSEVYAQAGSIAGTIVDAGTGRPLGGVSVAVVINDASMGTKTTANGKFLLTVGAPYPLILTVSSENYITATRALNANTKNLVIELEPENILGQEVVVSASRVPEEIIESPVSVERLGAETLRRTAAPSFYDALANLKGVDISTQSITFRSLNTRGFNMNGNVRLNQLIDGMDNQAPGLNFPIANTLGIPDIDIDNMELLPGASSALYGAGGTNGTLLMTSKNPFDYPGLTVQLRAGLNSPGSSAWPDLSLRYARAVTKKLAFKISGSYFSANDWEADDYSNFNRMTRTSKSGDRNSDLSYDGVNVYGDEPNLRYPTLSQIGDIVRARVAGSGRAPSDAEKAIIAADDSGLLPAVSPTRTGYLERDLIDYTAKSIRTSSALHYKIGANTEAVVQANWGLGSTVYTGSDRYSLKNSQVGQYKLEFRGKNFFVRGYTTQENSGDAYNATLLAGLLNESWKTSTKWLEEYAVAYSTAALQQAPNANVAARNFADRDRPLPGSAAFNYRKDSIARRSIADNGAAFNDKSNLYHYESMYNFSDFLKKGSELIVGASYRLYDLNSNGTVFADKNSEINTSEYGAYTQLGQKIGKSFKLTGSVRFDKNENFKGQITPRIAGVINVGSNKNIRASYQTGFRNPTNQNQYADLTTAGNSIRLIGGLPEIVRRNNLYLNKAYTTESYRLFLATGVAQGLEPYTFDAAGLRPEKVRAFELGFRGVFSRNLLLDSYAFFNTYRDYITAVEVYQNPTPNIPANLANAVRFNVPVNNPGRVTSIGGAMGLEYKLKSGGFTGNVSYNELGDIPNGFYNDFNTPKWRFNLGYSIREIVKNTSFYANYRRQSSFYWQSPFVSGNVPSFGTFDAQISIKVPALSSMIKIGGSNLLNKQYRTSYGNPEIGGMYYVSLLFDQFLR